MRPAGSAGSAGSTGSTGPTGSTGSTGSTGPTGSADSTGSTGLGRAVNARKSFRSLLIVAGFTGLVLSLAVVSPVLVGWLLEHNQDSLSSQNSLLACLFLPTVADWPSHVLSYILLAVVLLGLLLGLGSLLRQWYRTRRLVLTLQTLPHLAGDVSWQRLLTALKLTESVDLIETDTDLAFCYGWLHPRICISTSVAARLDETEIKALLLHEEHHLLRRDPLKAVIARVLATAFFFLPAIKALQQQYMLAKEIEADEHVLRTLGNQRPLLGALYKLLFQQSEGQRGGGGATQSATVAGSVGSVGSVGSAGSIEEVNQRLDYLLNGRVPGGLRLHILFASSAMLAAIGTVVVLATWVSAASALWHQAHTGMGGC